MMLPSKKVASLFILTGALVASIVIAFGRDKGSQVINVAQNLVAGEQISLPQNPEWQNELGSVTADIVLPPKEEVSVDQNTTDIVSTSLVANYLTLKQDENLNSTTAENLVNQALSYIEKDVIQIQKITNFNIIPDNGSQSISAYGETLGLILKNNKPKTVQNELEIIYKAVEVENVANLDKLDPIIAIYEKIGKELQAMLVPKSFVKAHTDITSGVFGIASSLKATKVVITDPVSGLSAIGNYKESVDMFIGSLQATVAFIKQNRIVYKQGSGGYYLLYGI